MWLFGVRVGAAPTPLGGGDATQREPPCGSPLATSLTFRGMARWAMGLNGWTEDFDRALAMARSTDPVSQKVPSETVRTSRCVLSSITR